jgi:YVTN family beta-propeller protein
MNGVLVYIGKEAGRGREIIVIVEYDEIVLKWRSRRSAGRPPSRWSVASVTVIRTATNKVSKHIRIAGGAGPVFIAIPPHGKFAYVANEFDSVISTVNIATKKAGPSIPVGLGPRMIAFTPDGKKAYVPNVGISHVGNGYRVTPINTVKNTSIKGIFVALNPTYVVIAP